MNDELLIREAVAAEADQAVEPSAILAALREGRKPRPRRTGMLVTMAGFAVAAAVVAVVVPLSASRGAAPAPPAANVTPSVDEQNILVAGMDDTAMTDTMMLLRRNTDGSFRGLSLPRDTWVPGRPDTKLNQVYPAAGGSVQTFNPAAAQALVDTVTALTGVKIDHFAMVGMTGFSELATAIGGVEVCLKAPAKDAYANVDLPAGKQVLAGDQLLGFLRQRHGLPNGDLDRIIRQQAFLKSLVSKVAQTKDTVKLIDVAKKTVRVDQSWDLVEFAKQLLDKPAVTMATMPHGNPVQHHGIDGFEVDPAQLTQFAAKFLAGSDPPAGNGSTAPQVPADDTRCVN